MLPHTLVAIVVINWYTILEVVFNNLMDVVTIMGASVSEVAMISEDDATQMCVTEVVGSGTVSDGVITRGTIDAM